MVPKTPMYSLNELYLELLAYPHYYEKYLVCYFDELNSTDNILTLFFYQVVLYLPRVFIFTRLCS